MDLTISKDQIIKISLSEDEAYHTENIYREVKNNIKSGNINPEGPLIETPAGMKIMLKYHQKRLLHEMVEKEHIGHRVSSGLNLFCLADQVGSGKSIDIIALISHSPLVDQFINNKLIYRINKYSPFKGFVCEPTIEFKTNIIVIPHGIYNQRVGYITNCTSLTYYGITTMKSIETFSFTNLENGDYNIILIKSTRYNDFMKAVYDKYIPHINSSKNILENSLDNTFSNLKTDMSHCWTALKTATYDDQFIKNIEILREKLTELNLDLIKENIEKYGRYKLSS